MTVHYLHEELRTSQPSGADGSDASAAEDGDTSSWPRFGAQAPGTGRETAEAFVRRMYQEHASFLQSFTLRLTGGDRYWAEDVTQETLVRAWRLADRLQESGPRHMLPWLITVARRIVLNDLRARRSRPQEVLGTRLEAVPMPDEMEQALYRKLIVDALAKIAVAHRKVVVAIYLRGQSTEEVAQMLGVPLGTVKSRCYYGLRALRRVLHQQGVISKDDAAGGKSGGVMEQRGPTRSHDDPPPNEHFRVEAAVDHRYSVTTGTLRASGA